MVVSGFLLDTIFRSSKSLEVTFLPCLSVRVFFVSQKMYREPVFVSQKMYREPVFVFTKNVSRTSVCFHKKYIENQCFLFPKKIFRTLIIT